jgi:hypothetical protein
MLPSLIGIIASSGVAVGGDYESIATLSGSGAGRTFTSIPQTYTHLQLRLYLRDTAASSPSVSFLRFNGDTGNNYTYHYLRGNGTTGSASAVTAQGFMTAPYVPGSTELANNYGCVVIDILDYTNTNKNTTVRSLGGYDNNGSGIISLFSGLWLNTAAITSIQTGAAGASDDTYSHLALYGIKG